MLNLHGLTYFLVQKNVFACITPKSKLKSILAQKNKRILCYKEKTHTLKQELKNLIYKLRIIVNNTYYINFLQNISEVAQEKVH